MQFLFVIAVVASITIAQAAPAEAIAWVGPRVMVMLLGMAAIPAMAAIGSWDVARGLRRDAEHRGDHLARFAQLQRWHGALWLAVALGTLWLTSWPQVVRFTWGLDGLILVDDLLVLAPVLLPMVLSWAAFYEVERTMLVSTARPPGGRLAHVAFHFRYHLGVLLAPVLVVITVGDLLDWGLNYWGAKAEAAATIRLWVWLTVVGSIAGGFPLLLLRVWETEPLPNGPLRDRLLGRAAEWKIAVRDVLVWRTGDRVVNAAVAGFLPGVRYVLLTDALLARFDADQIEAILAHEAAHVRRKHLIARVLALVLPLILVMAAAAALGQPALATAGEEVTLSVQSGEARVGSTGDDLWLPLAMLVYAAIPFARFARLLEMEADLAACDALAGPASTKDGAGDRFAAPPSAARADCGPPTQRVAQVLERLAAVAGAPRDKVSWLHPSIAQRVEHLQAAGEDVAYRRKFFRQMESIRWFLLAATLGSVLYVCWASSL